MGPEMGQDFLAQGGGEVTDQLADPHDLSCYWFTSAGREPSVTWTWPRCPSRRTVSVTVSPGLCCATSSERSLFWKTGLPSTATTTSPPVFTCWSWKVVSP